MTNKLLPPFPWDWIASGTPSGNGLFNAYLVDATGRKLAAIWGKSSEKEAIADFILDACNTHSLEIAQLKGALATGDPASDPGLPDGSPVRSRIPEGESNTKQPYQVNELISHLAAIALRHLEARTTAAEAEVKRLREALREIASGCPNDVELTFELAAKEIARAALPAPSEMKDKTR